MINSDISQILERDLNKLKEELLAYPDAGMIWLLIPGISNSAGNLALHLAGNLRHFIGAELGHTGYIRDRDKEFTQKDVPLPDIIKLIDLTIAEVSKTLEQLDPSALTNQFPKEVGGMKKETQFILLHLLAHLTYNLGQINYHRRILSAHKM